ncbi:MAG: acyl-CoA dehydrogenase family protein, partial [Planctomycetota bacterium]
RYLPKIATGEIIGAYCLTEPSSGSDAASLKATAEKKNGYYLVNGTKCFVTNGGYADLFIVYARTNPDLPKAKGISAFLIEKKFEGVKVGPAEEKMGIRASSTVTLYLEDCKVPQENLLGEENKGFTIAMSTLDGGRIGVAAQSLGIAEAAFEKVVEYVKQRTQFGKKLSEYESIQWKISEMATNIDAARLLTYRAAKMRDKNLPHSREASMAKLFASTMCNKVVRDAVQILGGFGYFEESFVAKLFRDQRITELYEGTSEVQKIVIARQILK